MAMFYDYKDPEHGLYTVGKDQKKLIGPVLKSLAKKVKAEKEFDPAAEERKRKNFYDRSMLWFSTRLKKKN